MNAPEVLATTIALSALPPLGGDLDGGVFIGVTTAKDGKHYAVALLADKPEGELTWHWTADEYGGSDAWYQDFYYGNQLTSHETIEHRARAVRLIQLTA